MILKHITITAMDVYNTLPAKNLRLFYILLLCLVNCILGFTQDKRDHIWILGANQTGDGTILDFNHMPVQVQYLEKEMKIEGTITGICDEEGRLMFYSNGCYIANREHRLMDNGDHINPGINHEGICLFDRGLSIPQGAIALPYPSQPDKYLLFNLDMDILQLETGSFTLAPFRLYYHIIDMTGDGGLGSVTVKNEIAIRDTFARANIQAVRHANGNDWWVIIPKWLTNCYFLLPVTSAGIGDPLLKCAGTAWNDKEAGQAVFSPDGTKYLRFNSGNGLHIYDFDAETGDLYNASILEFPDNVSQGYTGISVSPNSRYAYASVRRRLYQIDLQAEVMASSAVVVAELDQVNIPDAPNFDMSALAPDGKIYIVGSGGSTLLHIIHRPDCPGELCYVEQRALEMPVHNYRSIPNFPHYRNEPSGETCDSIISGSIVVWQTEGIEMYPVPAQDHINIKVTEEAGAIVFELYNMTGSLVIRSSSFSGQTRIDLPVLVPGIYFYRMASVSGHYFKSGKLIIGSP